MKQIEVSIMGQSYLLGCPDGGEQQLRQAVSHVDREMCAIRDAGKRKARERIAVLAALNLAYSLTNSRAHEGEPAGEPAPGGHSLDEISALIHKLDLALDDDGQLI